MQIFRKVHDRIAWKLVDFCLAVTRSLLVSLCEYCYLSAGIYLTFHQRPAAVVPEVTLCLRRVLATSTAS